jgi:hypothetical protein
MLTDDCLNPAIMPVGGERKLVHAAALEVSHGGGCQYRQYCRPLLSYQQGMHSFSPHKLTPKVQGLQARQETVELQSG